MTFTQVVRVLVSIIWSLIRVRSPNPAGNASADHTALRDVLEALRSVGTRALAGQDRILEDYVERLSRIDPDLLSKEESLAYWINLYNAGALRLASRAERGGMASVLGVPGGFDRPFVTVNGRRLSLDAIEHAKIRRYGDPRIHGALVCGSVSCPTLRSEPYVGSRIDSQLDDQMRWFIGRGGVRVDREADRVNLSRVFQWYGGDFVRPHRMPTFLPARPRRILDALWEWVDPVDRRWIRTGSPEIEFDQYDWSLRCTVA